MTIFDYFVKRNNVSVSLSQYQKKVILVVNVASEWGLTDSNYQKLQTLYDTYCQKSFSILAFPCNQFGGQESKSNQEIQDFAQSYHVRFPVFDKINVNGEDESPLYGYLKNNVKNRSLISRYTGHGIMWNFTKFLCVDGVPIRRYEPTTSYKTIETDIKKYL